MHAYTLLLGSNLGNKIQILSRAKFLLQMNRCLISNCSSLYQSEPWGFEHNEAFVNQAVLIHTTQNLFQVYRLCMDIEKQLGRSRNHQNEGYTARPIDIDILFADSLIVQHPHIELPHPRLHLRKFVLIPLDEILPKFVHPIARKSVHQLLDECADTGWVKKIHEYCYESSPSSAKLK